MDTMSNVQSRATSAYGSRPTSPHILPINRPPPPLPVNSGPRAHTGYTPIHSQQSSLTPSVTVTPPTHQQYMPDPLYDTRGNPNSHSSDIF